MGLRPEQNDLELSEWPTKHVYAAGDCRVNEAGASCVGGVCIGGVRVLAAVTGPAGRLVTGNNGGTRGGTDPATNTDIDMSQQPPSQHCPHGAPPG